MPSEDHGEDAKAEAGAGQTAPDTSTTPEKGIEHQDPFKFPNWKKWLITITLAFTTFTATFGSSVFSAAITVTAKEFHTSETIMLLGVSLYVLGFALGPLIWGPLSEMMGRKTPLFTGYVIFALMQVPTALAHSLPTILICRFLAGSFASAPVVLVTATYADFWEGPQRGIASSVYSVAVYGGPTLGPLCGSFIVESRLGWRWTAWITLIMASFFGTIAFICTPETYAPVLKARAARQQLRQSSNEPLPKPQHNNLHRFVHVYLIRPILMLAFEPILDTMTLYISIAYGIQYLTFYAIPYAFTHDRLWRPQIATLPFLSNLTGVLTGCAIFFIYSEKYYKPRFLARGKKVVPEDRLPPVMLGAVLLPIGLFWFAWTSSRSISWVPQVMSCFFIGCGIMLIFSCGVVYIVDIYLAGAASALAANTCVRSFVAAGLPLAAPRMYSSLGVGWATSLLGFLTVVMVPAPFLFYRYGERLRGMSRFAAKSGS